MGYAFVLIIVLASLAMGAFATWLDFKKATRQLGTSAKDLEREVAALREKLEGLERQSERRLQNLEAIVTSQEWDDLAAGEAPLRDTFREITGEDEPGEPGREEQAAEIARKVSQSP